MEKKKEQRKNYKIRIDFTRLILSAVSIYFVICFSCQQIKLNQYRRQKEITEQGILKQKETLKKLEEEMKSENSDELLEKKARELGYIKPNEKIFVDINK